MALRMHRIKKNKILSMISLFNPCYCHAQSLPDDSELQQPVKSTEVFERLVCNEAVEFREENAPNESMMDVEYMQKDNSLDKAKQTENTLEIHRRKLHRDDKIKVDRTLKKVVNLNDQESSISGNRENKLHTEQDNVMGFGNQSKENKNDRKDSFVSAEISVSANNYPGERLSQQIVNGERQKIEGVSKKLSEVEIIRENKEKGCSRKAGSNVPAKEGYEMQSETNFELTMKKDEVITKTGEHAQSISPHKEQHFSAETFFECQSKEHCFTESSSSNTVSSEDKEFQVCGEDGDSLSGLRNAVPLEKVASTFRELGVHNRSEKMKLSLQSVGNPGISGSIERDANKLHRTSLGKSYFIKQSETLEKSTLNRNEARSTTQEILAFSSGNISENQHATKVSQSNQPVESDPSFSTELLRKAGDLNSLSEIISGGDNHFPFSEHGLAKKILSHEGEVSEKKISQGKNYGLDNINISRKKLSGEDKLEQDQKCKDLLLVAEMDSKDKGHNTKVPGKTTGLQKTFCENTGNKNSLDRRRETKTKDSGNEDKRSTTITEVPEFLCNANRKVKLRMILNQSKSTFESENMSRSSDLKLIQYNLNNAYTNDILITVHFDFLF
ncbi:uncharacterized protein LOC126913240 [Cygnus atratus]|uniref:uncharacterized protein LOC126913240 n=1 Tax=Cygnus atratus TaxID=8868 RepID=UPI0021B7F4BA|nr:uncharacterized protein LOC126913240 [Cygnus atratus]